MHIQSGSKNKNCSKQNLTLGLFYLAPHANGLPEYPDNLKRKNKENPFASYSKEQLYEFLRSYQLEKPIGFDYKHVELGIALLGQILSLKMKKSFDSLITERILIPLNMPNTRISLSDEQQKHFLNGFNEKGNAV